MTDQIQFKRRINGAAGSPSTTGAKEGEIALNFPKIAGSTDKPDIWAFDGAAWRHANPSVAVTTQSITLPAGADIGAAYTTWATTPANTLTGNVIIATFGTPAQAYILTTPAAPGTASSWTSLGGATTFATQPQVDAGTDTSGAVNSATLRGTSLSGPTGGGAPVAGDANKLVRLDSAGKVSDGFVSKATSLEIKTGTATTSFITPAGLRGTTVAAPTGGGAVPVAGDVDLIPRLSNTGAIDHRFIPKLGSTSGTTLQTGTDTTAFLTAAGLRAATVIVSAGAGDANKLPRLDATGKLDATMLPASATHLAGALDPTAAPPVGATSGSMYFANKDGVINAGFTGITAATAIKTSDALIFDGTKWHHIPNGTDLNAYVPLAGTNLMTGSIVYSGAAGNKAGTVIYDGKGGTIDNVLLDCGTY
jgi:hypothetical protein